jgi:glutamine synthetase
LDPGTPYDFAVRPIAEQTHRLTKGLTELKEAKAAADAMSDTAAMAEAYCDRVKPLFDVVRSSIDMLEGLVDDKIWPLPKYRELLFLR